MFLGITRCVYVFFSCFLLSSDKVSSKVLVYVFFNGLILLFLCDATRERLPTETICCMDEFVDDGISGSF